MNECSKAVVRRMHDPAFATRYFAGIGIDIGAGSDGLNRYAQFFPRMRGCKTWDVGHGDAQLMFGVPNANFDFVHSSHCLEHLRDPKKALDRWVEITAVGGHIICVVPDEDMYEQGVWPSTFNADHKHTFTIYKEKSWSPVSVNLLDLLKHPQTSVQQIKLLNVTHRPFVDRFDQTLTAIGESAIEFVVRKES